MVDKFDVDELRADAERRTGLSDWSGWKFHDGLRSLTRTLKAGAGLPPVGYQAIRSRANYV
ncbi:MAG: hypothetical protein ACRDTK_01095 [Mycobacterium sp.]